MIDEFKYQMLLDICDQLTVTRQAVRKWKKSGKVPLTHALKADSITQGKLNAYDLTGGYTPTHAKAKLANLVIETINNDEACVSTAHILNYLQEAHPPLYNTTVEILLQTQQGEKYISGRIMHTGESSEAQHGS